MMNILLFIHIVISVLLVTAILLHKTGADSLSGLSGRNEGIGIVTSKAATSFLTRIIVILATCFFINAIILANLSSKKNISITDKLQLQDSSNTVPLAK
ncbi:preprotein translocase, SecG subunit [Orientia tsutsugamushi str. Gilliam]|uniref:Protein-export membrane protein SecG n=1 Tax=Orientia tsutsugamushi str. Gilliam TaxID=1359184 RepID=A0A0F3MGV2_ORITS|nr:preprotein translocase subunit SecG [Orientia tsutsugamushi]KJV53784.1 preprotein translocase, SecG subunit [Orientia tsutsugamushi str. Gilliam]SPR03158.1 preprotein translocase subunit SecG [Orientia tsutsugamushi str. Gilliam]